MGFEAVNGSGTPGNRSGQTYASPESSVSQTIRKRSSTSFFLELCDALIGGSDFLLEPGHFRGVIELLPRPGKLLLELPDFLVFDVELFLLLLVERHGVQIGTEA